MNIGIFINDVQTESPRYATTCMALAALARGHTVWYVGIEDFAYDPDDWVRVRACTVPGADYADGETFLADLKGKVAREERIMVGDLDVLLLRNNPADDYADRPWAQSVGLLFGQLAVQQGVIVLNDPHHLAHALNKLYFQTFPREVRPETLITRDRDEIKAFVAAHGDQAVLKPLQGSGGHNVFVVRPQEKSNLNQIIDAICRDGYVVVQEYLPAAAEGDLRLFMFNGQPLVREGKYAAFCRVCADDDLRSNMHAGGRAERAEIDETVLHIADVVRPKLIQDGLFLVGLDIAGDKLMEVNVFSPGGLYSMQQLEGVDFADAIIEALEHKVAHARRYHHAFDNVRIATM